MINFAHYLLTNFNNNILKILKFKKETNKNLLTKNLIDSIYKNN